jgi:hypothetical protein
VRSLANIKTISKEAPTPINPIRNPPDKPTKKITGMAFNVIGISILE